MPDFSSTYTEPGVYIQYQDAAIPAAPAGALIPAIIGLGSKSMTITDTIVRGATTTTSGLDLLSKTTSVLIVSSVTDRNTTYVKSTNYTVDTTHGGIQWVTSTPSMGSEYYVTYSYRKAAADYGPVTTVRMEDIESQFGPAQYYNTLAVGTVSVASSTSIQVAGVQSANTSANFYQGNYIKITSGAAVGIERLVLASTYAAPTTTFTVASLDALPTSPDVVEINDISTNTLSIGAKMAIQNGAGYILCVQATDNITGSDTGGTGWEGAIYKLRNQTCYCLVPMIGMSSASTTIMTYLESHVDSMSTILEKRFRTGLIGAPVNTVSVTTITSSAAVLDNYRMCYIAPSTAKLTLGATQKTVDGSYIASAVAGIVCNPNYTWGEPISGKQVVGFDDIINPFVRAEMNSMAGNGVMVIEAKTPGNFRIRHALSTDPSTAVTQEFKITRIKDGISYYLMSNLEATFINTRNIGNETISNIKAFMKLLLNSVAARQDITEYSDPDVRVSPNDPRQINITFSIKPTWDINWIKITFGVAL